MLDHLHPNGVELDDNDVAQLVTTLYAQWDLHESPAMKLARDDKIEKQLTKKKIAPQPLMCLALAKAAFETTGEYKVALKAFESKPAPDQTFENFARLLLLNIANTTRMTG